MVHHACLLVALTLAVGEERLNQAVWTRLDRWLPDHGTAGSAGLAAQEARHDLAADVPVGVHLADQLLLPLALAGGGTFRTPPLSRHASTNMDVIRQFLGPTIDVERRGDTAVEVTVRV